MDFGFAFSSNFWSQFHQHKPSPRFEDLLSKPDLTVEELLTDPETLSEIQNSN
jgi:hypothetical protein